ncbi:MAG: hypothetical protein ACRD26_23555 [Vicinamibacterales bacterium]
MRRTAMTFELRMQIAGHVAAACAAVYIQRHQAVLPEVCADIGLAVADALERRATVATYPFPLWEEEEPHDAI